MGSALTGILVMAAVVAAPARAAGCDSGPAGAAAANTASFETLEWAPFRRPERGWAIYAPRISVEIGTRCAPWGPGFAAALAAWQRTHALPATGILDLPSFGAMNRGWTLARPFVLATLNGNCPDPPPLDRLSITRPDESFGGRAVRLRMDTLVAYRAMAAAARRELPHADSERLRIFSGFRAPDDDAARCSIEGNCQGIVRAQCSSHRTGLAVDIEVGSLPGVGPDSSEDSNRRFMVRTLAYRWLLTNARRFGFVNYVFEPWHWEWMPGARKR